MHAVFQKVHTDLVVQLRGSRYNYRIYLSDEFFRLGLWGAVVRPREFLRAHYVRVAHTHQRNPFHFGKGAGVESSDFAGADNAEFDRFVLDHKSFLRYYLLYLMYPCIGQNHLRAQKS